MIVQERDLDKVVKSGADGRSRTDTACATAPSRLRVYQFHHIGLINFLVRLMSYHL